jgi:hypothetical protein
MVVKVQSLIRRVYRRIGPTVAATLDHEQLQAQAADFFGLPLENVRQLFAEYRALHEQKEYARLLGESKTLVFEEAFLFFVAASLLRPQQVVEIGTQLGKSTRRLVDMLTYLKLNSRVTCFDIVNDVRFVSAAEVDLRIQDITDTFGENVLIPLAPELIFLDAHPYHLTRNAIAAYLKWSLTHPCILAIHDCSPAEYVPYMLISKGDPGAIGSNTGFWERHILSELFNTPNNKLDDLSTATHRLRVFNTPYGLGLIAPLTLLEQTGKGKTA